MIDYYVRRVKFPNRSCPALVVPNDDGSFDIYINTLFPPDKQAEALEHELRHLKKDHFYKEEPISKQEAEADGTYKRPHSVNPKVKPGEPTRMIPLFNSLQQLADFYEKLDRDGRCGDYVLRHLKDEA